VDLKKKLDWAAILARDAKTKAVISSRELAKKFKLPVHSVVVSLGRQQKRGLVERVHATLYLNKLSAGFSPKDVVNQIDPSAYVSLDSALVEWGISTQSPIGLTCVSAAKTRIIRSPSAFIKYRKIKKDLYWGFLEKKSRFGTYKLAEPEKALLDWLYFRYQDGLPANLDEFQFQNINLKRLFEGAKKFPKSVREILIPHLLERLLVDDKEVS
jgi:predicted transcriptional regulator of viral defense system